MVAKAWWIGASLAVVSCSGWSDPVAVVESPAVALPWLGLPANSSLAGTIRDGTGVAIGEAQGCAWDDSVARVTSEDQAPRCAIAGPDGAYVIAGLRPAAYHVQASAPGFHAATSGARLGLGPGERRRVRRRRRGSRTRTPRARTG